MASTSPTSEPRLPARPGNQRAPGDTRTRPGRRTRTSLQFEADTKRTFRIDRTNLPPEVRDVGQRGVEAARAALACEPSPAPTPFELKVLRLPVTVVHRDAYFVAAIVDGDHGTYHVECDSRGWWSCSCPHWGERCTHVAAVKRVVGIGGAA